MCPTVHWYETSRDKYVGIKFVLFVDQDKNKEQKSGLKSDMMWWFKYVLFMHL